MDYTLIHVQLCGAQRRLPYVQIVFRLFFCAQTCTCGLHKGRTVIESHHWRILLLCSLLTWALCFLSLQARSISVTFVSFMRESCDSLLTTNNLCLNLNPVLDKEHTQKQKCKTRKSEGQGSVCLSKYITYKGLVLWSIKFCAVLKLIYVILKSCDSLYEPALFISFWKQSDRIFLVCLTMGVSLFVPFSSLSVEARRSPQAFLWPPLPDRLNACQRVSKTPDKEQQRLEVSEDSANLDSLGVCVCVEFCGEGCSAFVSLMLHEFVL